MATDNTSSIAGDYPGGIRITCILDEGAPTIVESFDTMGNEATAYTFATPLAEKQGVALSNDTAGTYAECGGIPLVERPVSGETLVIGRIVSTPKLNNMPAVDADANTLAERLTGGYYRTALVELWAGITKVTEATVTLDGTNGVVQGVGTTLLYNLASSTPLDDENLQLITAASTGVGLIPLHYIADATIGDTHTILVGITGMMIAITGA